MKIFPSFVFGPIFALIFFPPNRENVSSLPRKSFHPSLKKFPPYHENLST